MFIDLTGDAGLYATISRQLAESGNWFNLKINGEFYNQKPHLLFWLSAAGIKFFGNTNFAYKLFPVLFGLSSVYFSFRLAKSLYGSLAGKLAALFCATSQLFVLYHFDIHTDTVLQAAVTLALWQLLEYLKNKKSVNFIFGFLGVGLAMLAKGPIGAVLPFFVVLGFLLLKKQSRELFRLKWLLGVAIVLIVASPSLIFLYKTFGLEGITFFFITNNLGRITGELTGTSTDPFFYVTTILWAFVPWVIFLPMAIFNEIKSWRALNKNAESASLLLSVLVLLLVLSIARGKAPNYILIIISPLSVLVAKWVAQINWQKIQSKKAVTGFYRFFIVLLFLFVSAVIICFGNKNVFLLVSNGLLLVALIYLLRKKEGQLHYILALLLVSATLNFALNTVIIPQFFTYQGARQALAIYEKNRGTEDRLINLHNEEYELFYYSNSPVKQFAGWDEFYRQFEQPGTWVYTTKAGYQGILELNHQLEKVYKINYRDMNDFSLSFLNPKKRNSALKENYLIKVK